MKMKGGQMREQMHLLYLEGHRFIYIFSLWDKWGMTNGTNLRFNALFRYECAPSFKNLPNLCIILHKTVPHYRGKTNDSLGQFSWFNRSYKGTNVKGWMPH